MKIIVVYKSKTGFTEKYAQWIASEISADTYKLDEFKKELFKDYDIIVYGGSLHAVGIDGINLIKNNLSILKDKNIIVFAVGASPDRKETVEEIKNNNFTIEQLEKIKLFYLRGGFDYNKLPLVDKFLMKLLQLKLKRKKNLSADEKGMLNSYNKPVDFSGKENTKEIISYINSLIKINSENGNLE